jgi:membrane-bound serine protease (ClpP class)
MSRSALRPTLISALVVAGALLLAGAVGAQGQDPSEGGLAYSIELTGTIDPATEQWVEQALEEAEERRAELIIIRLDTPGGLVDSMREIVKDIIAAPAPVVVYVSPDGARAASAGLFITQAGDVAAMAPQTNIGSATPISIGPGGAGEIDETLGRKIENDAAAYVRALTAEHGRNADLAEEMVRDATNVPAATALERNLIDAVAAGEAELLAELDGFRVQGPKAQTLDTDGLVIETRDMPLQFDLLQIIVNPNVSFLLLLIGLAGLGFEIFNPGTIVPGAIGGVSLLLGLYGTAQLPVELAGLLLLLLAVGLIVAETQLPTGGLLGGAGVLALAASGLLLYDTNSDEFGVSPPVVIVLAVVIGVGMIFVVRKVVEARANPVLTGWEELVGAEGEVRRPLDPVGQVFVGGTLWRARAAEGAAEEGRIGSGARVLVESVDGLTLDVRPLGAGAERAESQAEREGAES